MSKDKGPKGKSGKTAKGGYQPAKVVRKGGAGDQKSGYQPPKQPKPSTGKGGKKDK